MQNNFLWGGAEAVRKIYWVSWENLCLPFGKGGIGMKRIEEFNIYLLLKWRWRMLEVEKALWLDILKARYDSLAFYFTTSDYCRMLKHCSLWWKSLCSLDNNSQFDAFKEKYSYKLGGDSSIPFWTAV
ncbi:unnamed protein product [Lathyrus sativus]|nr:unnamed protein product [Lathyrus sativus]